MQKEASTNTWTRPTLPYEGSFPTNYWHVDNFKINRTCDRHYNGDVINIFKTAFLFIENKIYSWEQWNNTWLSASMSTLACVPYFLHTASKGHLQFFFIWNLQLNFIRCSFNLRMCILFLVWEELTYCRSTFYTVPHITSSRKTWTMYLQIMCMVKSFYQKILKIWGKKPKNKI